MRSRVVVEVWDTGRGLNGTTGETGGAWQGYTFNPRLLPARGTPATRVWVMARNANVLARGARTQEERGETYVHELVVHAWRRLRYGFYFPQRHERNTREAFERTFSHRSGEGHGFGNESRHNLADIESDVLFFYLRGREPLRSPNGPPHHAPGWFRRYVDPINNGLLRMQREALRRRQRTGHLRTPGVQRSGIP
jgi:hypothetical protein